MGLMSQVKSIRENVYFGGVFINIRVEENVEVQRIVIARMV
jgi:hypothetical protein